jgi:hypothetical protein
MKNIFINNEQYRLIKESLENNRELPSWLKDSVDSKQFPLSSDKSFINVAIMRMLETAYENAVSSFSDDITSFPVDKIENKLNKLILICQKKEDKIKAELEKLCADIVLSLFELNGKDLELECNLVTSVPQTKNFHVKPDTKVPVEYDSIDEINLEDSDEIRRRYTNTITIGAALELTDKLLTKCVKEIFALDEELPYLYTKIIKINNYLLLIKHDEITDDNNQQDAYVETSVDDSSNYIKILVEGTIFPFLLTEAIRGCIEVLTFNTLPEKRADYIVNRCDTLQDEPYYMVLGRVFWNIMCGEDFNDIYTEKLLQKLASLDNEKFNALMDEVLVGTKLGRDAMNKIMSKIKYDSDYQSFEKELADKRKEKEIIVDGYFTESELGGE